MEHKNGPAIYPLAMTGMMAAVIAVTAPFAVPVGPIPLSLCSLMVCLAGYVLGWKLGGTAVLVYVLLGAVGMPVFSSFASGVGKLLGPTGGYILGYLPLALLTGWAAERFPDRRRLQLLGMALGTAVLYALGTLWYCFQAKVDLEAALSLCVLPFLPGDLVKLAVAAAVGPVLRRRLEQAGLRQDL